MKKIFLSDIDFGNDEIKAVNKVLKKKWLSQGHYTARFEKVFCNYLKCRYACALSSCTAALHLALKAVGIKPDDEVIVPSLTFVATVNAVLYMGARPVFADVIGLDDLTISPEDVSKKVTRKTKAIVVMHYGGYPCRMDNIKEIADRHGLFIIEDAAHAIGGKYRSRMMGTLGHIGCFSFFANKNLVTGEGGMAVTDNSYLAKRIRLLRSHAMTTLSWERHKGDALFYDVVDLGYNYRFDEIRAVLGIIQLKKIHKNNLRRKKVVEYYRQKLKDVAGVSLPFHEFSGTPSYHLFPVLLDRKINRRKFMIALREQGIQTSMHFPPVHKFSYYKRNFHPVTLPLTEEVGRRVVTLPLHPLMQPSDVDFIADKIRLRVGKMLQQAS